MAASTLESRMTPRSAPPAADRKLASSEYLFNLARKHCPGFANIVLSSELRYAGSGNVSPSERFSERHLADCVKALMRRRWMLGVTVDEKGATDGKSGGKAQLVWHPDAEPGPSHVHLASVEQVLTDLTGLCARSRVSTDSVSARNASPRRGGAWACATAGNKDMRTTRFGASSCGPYAWLSC